MAEDFSATARTFLDFEGLGRLRGQARADATDREALREAARQFEAQMKMLQTAEVDEKVAAQLLSLS